jgi:hypothetical protein
MLHGIGGYLIGLAVGYWVLTHADKQKGRTKTVGQVVAWTIMVIALCGTLCVGYCRVLCPSDAAQCGFASGMSGKGCH